MVPQWWIVYSPSKWCVLGCFPLGVDGPLYPVLPKATLFRVHPPIVFILIKLLFLKCVLSTLRWMSCNKCYFKVSWIFTKCKKERCIDVIGSGKTTHWRASFCVWSPGKNSLSSVYCSWFHLGMKCRFSCLFVLHFIDLLEHIINRNNDVWKHKYLLFYIFIKISVIKLQFSHEDVKEIREMTVLRLFGSAFRNRLDREVGQMRKLTYSCRDFVRPELSARNA